jgi:hypothetical protein
MVIEEEGKKFFNHIQYISKKVVLVSYFLRDDCEIDWKKLTAKSLIASTSMKSAADMVHYRINTIHDSSNNKSSRIHKNSHHINSIIIISSNKSLVNREDRDQWMISQPK